jgi:photosystem II stability/assembly factor-like uncharacterized protein
VVPAFVRAALSLAALSSCGRHPDAPPARPRITEGPTAPLVRPSTNDPTSSDVPAHLDDPSGCAAPPLPTTGQGWSFVGFNPGPTLRDAISAGRHLEALVATTRTGVCVSRDGGVTWASAFEREGALASPVAVELEASHTLLVIAQGTAARPTAPQVFVSRDVGRAWEPLALPSGAGASARVFTDRRRTVWAVSGTRLWWSDDARGWRGPRTMPGRGADGFDACGPVLIARVQLANDKYWHHSDDEGATWRPMRLGHLGIDGGDGNVRCLGWRDVIEAGHGTLPSHWSFDGGRTWERARYDDRARAAARALVDEPDDRLDSPHCASTPHGALACLDARRVVFPDLRERGVEVMAPAACERIRVLDDHRMLAFGPSCGVYLSNDRGGLWRRMSTSVDPERARRAVNAGRGGFLSAKVVWRIDDGIWWSDDVGARWRQVISPGTRPLSWGVFVDRRHGVFARDDGWIVSTRDGGETWSWVLHEEVERLASAGSWLMLTTASRVRVSPDGGETWRASLPFPSDVRVDPTLTVEGPRRWIDVSPGVRVSQSGGRIEVITRATGAPHSDEVVRGLGAGWEMLSAHATNGVPDRVLLMGGAVLRRELPRDATPRWEVRASAGASSRRHRR